jgi:oleate hydratase
MKAHIVGGGFAGLAAARLLIRNARVPGPDITIYEAKSKLGGGYFVDGDPQHGYNLPGSVFDKEFRCGFDVLSDIRTLGYPNIYVSEQFFTFNNEHPFDDQTHIVSRDLSPFRQSRYGLNMCDGVRLAKLSLSSEASLDGKRIEEFFPARFFRTEFWLLWSTIMGSLPQHSLIEFRRYMNRFVYLFPDLSSMAHVLRSQFNQYEAFVKPLAARLDEDKVNFVKDAFVSDIGFAESGSRLTVDRLDVVRGGNASTVKIAPEDIVLVTTGSQAADYSAGTMSTPPGPPRNPGQSWALWEKLAQKDKRFGNPDAFFGTARIADSRWVTFTVTTTSRDFIDAIINLTHSGEGSGGLLTLKDSNWVLSFSIFDQPEVLGQPPGTEVVGQPPGTYVWWGYGLYPDRDGDIYKRPMRQCTGEEILREILHHLGMKDGEPITEKIVSTSICIPCDMPYVNNIWLPRKKGDRPAVVPEGVTNLGLMGQYVELEKDIAFTFEYSTRSAWEAIYRLLKRGPAPPDVYQGQWDPKGVWAATKVFLGLTKT